ncbi:Uncharacterized protein F1880_005535 [Penicillium rolfsii]|nr:Uncharacterized protein F1880_005535 [Penicillium rolfsii]
MFQRLSSLLGKSTSFQILSDLHLEVNQQYLSFEIPVRAKYLILAGDIGRLVDYDNYRNFIQKQTDRFELVFLALGNHEFYNDTFATGLKKARQLEQEPCLNGRLILLHQRAYDIPCSSITILGCTLWSKIPDESKEIVRLKIQDFKNIQDWTIDKHNASHDADRTWLLDKIKSITIKNKTQNQKRDILVVTHHAPSLKNTSSPQYANSPWSCAFGTGILPQIEDSSSVKAWVFGHTHYSTEFQERGIRVVANQRGYVLSRSEGEKKKKDFDVGRIIEV